MINEYYYLVASLPYLEFAKALPIARDEFLSQSSKWLSPSDFLMLSNIDINDFKIRTGDPGLLKEWKLFDLTLREGLAEVRRVKKSSLHTKIPDSVKNIFEESNPLLMERQIQKTRWDFLEEKEFGYHFDINVLIVYHLKLQVLERLTAFNKEKGETMFSRLCEVTYG